MNTEPRNAPSRQRRTFSAAARVNPAGDFEILAITAGSGNGWEFSPEVLQESLPLWDDVESFVDHAWAERSVRDLAGVCTHPTWDALQKGVRLILKAVGPAAGLLLEMGKTLASQSEPLPEVGFSADILFSAEGSRVTRIHKVFSVDLVVHPARGGTFLTPLGENPWK